MREKIPLTILFLFLTGSLYAQQHMVDSITCELTQPMPDSNRAMSMMRLAVDYEAIDTARAFEGYKNAIRFTSEKKLYYHLGRIYQNQSFLYNTATNYPQAIASLDNAIASYRKSDHPKAKLWEANAYNDKANCLKAQNEFQPAVEYYLKSISLMEELGQPGGLVNKYANLSTLFGDMGENAKQIEYAHKAVAVAREQGDRKNLFMAYFILANAYSMKEDNAAAKNFIDSSTAYFNEVELADNINLLFSYYLVTAQVFKKIDQPDSAYYFFNKAYEVSRSYNYGYGKAEAQLQMGAIAIIQKKYSEAEKHLLAGIEEAEAVNYFGILDEGYKYLSDVYAVTNRYKEAYEYFQKYKEVNDSMLNMESRKYGKDLEQKYETAKKDRKIILQQSQLREGRILNLVLIGSAAILLIIAFLYYRYYKQKQKLQQQRINELEKEKQLSATEAVLKGEEQERTRLARDLHDGLGGMLSGIKYSLNTMKGNLIMTPENAQAFERSIDMLDSSIKEMRRVAHHMMPEALVKFGLDTALRDFCSDINRSGALQVNYQSIGMEGATVEQTTAITIYRIVQELINNVIKHASASNAIVQVSRTNEQIAITVEDDGKGFDPEILKGARGIGWHNIQSRVEYLRGRVDVQSAPGRGTSVMVEINPGNA